MNEMVTLTLKELSDLTNSAIGASRDGDITVETYPDGTVQNIDTSKLSNWLCEYLDKFNL